jgi:hypothetical protein
MSQGRRELTRPGWQRRGSGRASARRCSDDNGGLRWSPTIGDAPCRSMGEREVSEGRGLGEERLGGRSTEEREESSGADQILPDDGAPVLGRATGNIGSGRRRSARVARAWTRGERVKRGRDGGRCF